MNAQKKLIPILACTLLAALAAHCGRKGPDAPPDVTPPTVLSTQPTGSNVPANTAIIITFSEPVNEDTIVFTLVDQTNTIPVARSVSGAKVVFTPTALLADNTLYTALLNSGVKDLAGNAMVAERSWYFRTAPTTTSSGTAYTVTAAAGANGAITPSGPVRVNQGETQAFTVTANTGFHISSVTGCGGSLSGKTYTTGPVTADCTVTATFAANATGTHTITVTSGSNGSVSPAGPVTVNDGAIAKFTVSPNAGYHISSVTGCGGSLSGGIYTTSRITTDCTVAASFAVDAPAPHTITASVAGGHGTISPSGRVAVADGQDQTFKMQPEKGYSVQSVTVDGAPAGRPGSYTFTNVTADHTISVSFSRDFLINSSAGPNGSIAPAGTVTVIYGGSMEFTMTPNAGFSVADVLVDNLSVGPTGTYIFTAVTADHTINAVFAGIAP